MFLNTFFIAARLENEVLNDRISELETLITQILLFVNYILKKETAISTKATDSFLVHDRLNVREALVEIACATLIIALSLTE